MTALSLPPFLADRRVTHEEALAATVRSGTRIASGFATSEPHTFYARVWDHIRAHDLHDLEFKQALFLAPHKLLLGDTLSARGVLGSLATPTTPNVLRRAATPVHQATRKLDGVRRLAGHYQELRERRIRFVSAFLGPASNTVLPDNAMMRSLFPDLAGRNSSRMGITDMQSVHFPDAPDALFADPEGRPIVDLLVVAMTPPNEEGELSHGVACGATHEALEIALREGVKILLYLNPRLPFTWGYPDSPNTLHVDRLKDAAEAGRLFVVADDGKIPSLPSGAYDKPSPAEKAIADHVVNHIEAHKDLTRGRALQVGIGTTGVLAIRGLRSSSWSGRLYTEMLEPFSYDLFEEGKVAGSHFIEADGRRTELDGKLVCTFTMAEEGSGFYDKLHRNRAVVLAAASRVVIPEGFYGGLGINNILSLDFQGHVNSGGRDQNHYSGVGGAAVISRGLARGGVAYLCCKSTHTTPAGDLRSSIFPFLPGGTPISLIGPDLMGTRAGAHVYLATEHGVARINARSQSEFIRSLVSVAHPQFRGWLARRAWEEFRVQV